MKSHKSYDNVGKIVEGVNLHKCMQFTKLLLCGAFVALLTACPAPGGDEIDVPPTVRAPNANPSTQLQTLSVYYSADPGTNLITFDGTSAQSSVSVKAKAKSSTAKVQIIFAYGIENGSTGEEATRQEETLTGIPISST
jgi:hypothetical protein